MSQTWTRSGCSSRSFGYTVTSCRQRRATKQDVRVQTKSAIQDKTCGGSLAVTTLITRICIASARTRVIWLCGATFYIPDVTGWLLPCVTFIRRRIWHGEMRINYFFHREIRLAIKLSSLCANLYLCVFIIYNSQHNFSRQTRRCIIEL